MIQRNVSGQPILLPVLWNPTDGTPGTSGAAIAVRKDGVDVGTPAGTLAHVAGGVWQYTPSQGETDCGILGLVLTLADHVSVPLNLVTTTMPVQTEVGAAGGVSVTDANGKVAAKYDWEDDVTNKPTIGTSTFDHTGNQVIVATVNDKSGYSLSSAGILAIWQAAVASITTAGSIGKRIVDYLTGDAFARLGAPNGASIAEDIAAVPANVEAAILDEGDATALLAAIAAKVEAFLINDGDAAATLASIATAVNAAVVAGQIGTDLATAKASAATAATASSAAKLITDKLDTMLESDGADGYQLTTLALDNITLSATLCNKIADHVARRTHTNIEASSDGDALSLESLYGVGRTIMRANTTATAGTLTILKTDGSTLGTRTLDTDTGLEDVQGIGP